MLKRGLFLILLVVNTSAFGQSILDSKLDGTEQGQLLIDFLHKTEKEKKAKFFFLDEWVERISIRNSYKDVTLRDALSDILNGTDITFVDFFDYGVIFSKDPSGELERESLIKSAKAGQIKVQEIVLGDFANAQPGKLVEISGTVIDQLAKSPMIGVAVSIGNQQQVVTSIDGTYRLSVKAGEHVMIFRFLNYEEKVIDIKAYASGVVDIGMLEIPKMLEEVVISDQQMNATGRIGQTNLKLAEIKRMPTFLGEVDVIKQVQVLPGVTSVGEVSSGFNVRGGGVDQNLVLFDGLPVFNNSHVFGLFSSFNSETIKEAGFFKGGIPAEFGGRVSSVLNIASKEGDYKKWEATGGIGLVATNLTVGGPILKEKTSVIVSLRSSYSDWLLKAFSTDYQELSNSSVTFYDASIKLSHKFSEKDKLSFSGYASSDNFGLPSDTTFKWKNSLASIHYDHIFNPRAFGSFTAGFGKYGYQVTDEDPISAYTMDYSISYPTLKGDFNYQLGRHKLAVGFNAIYYKIAPGAIAPGSDQSNVVPLILENEQSLESGVFLSDGFDVNEKLHIDAGLRISYYNSMGPATVYNYQPGVPMTEESLLDSTVYSSGQSIKQYAGPEPRLAIRYSLGPNSSIKLGYNRIYQYIHLISNSVSVTPIDIWQPSNNYFKPQIGDQVSMGYFRNFRDNKYEFSAEAFYKSTDNILEFKDGSDLVLNPRLETALLTGVAQAYGIEFSITKALGRLSGNLNYTYSRSLRQVTGDTPETSINEGSWYPSNYDQPNIVNLTLKYGLSKRFFLTSNFTYRTGRPVTVPVSYSEVDNVTIVNYSDRNQYRVPDYNRLDVALVMEGNHRRKKLWDGTWVLSVYNVYARKNVYSIFYRENEQGLQQAYRMTIIGTVLPSVSYRFKI